jgi:hypothetical protein
MRGTARLDLDYSMRGALLRQALGDRIDHLQAAGKSRQEVEKAINDGLFTVLFDDDRKFIERSFIPLPPNAPAS